MRAKLLSRSVLDLLGLATAAALVGTPGTPAAAQPQTEAESPAPRASPRSNAPPNILFILMDNLGYGEIGAYGGGIVRGAPTPRLDALAREGLQLTNFNVEPQCTPSRSAFMTGRFAIRSGTHSIPKPGSTGDGLTQWEVTIAELLATKGYATGHFGKWHLGSDQGRLPNDQGFDEWYGIPRTTDESLWVGNHAAHAAGIQPMHVMEGRKGQPSRELAVYDLDQRRRIDAEAARRATAFMKQSVKAQRPFFAYVPFTQVHFPTLPHPDFAGRTGQGDFADALAEMDARVGALLDEVDALGVRDNTIVIFTSDNGPDPTYLSNGSSGPWRGYYFTHMEGSLRVPFLIRWPKHVPAGRVSNEIVHQVDTFATLAAFAGAQVPRDRAIDALDQSAFFLGKTKQSSRDGFPVFVADRLEAVKWRDWKLALYEEQRDWWSPPIRLGAPKLFNLIADPKEEYPQATTENTWVSEPTRAIIAAYMSSVRQYPLIEPGTPDPYNPPAGSAPPVR